MGGSSALAHRLHCGSGMGGSSKARCHTPPRRATAVAQVIATPTPTCRRCITVNHARRTSLAEAAPARRGTAAARACRCQSSAPAPTSSGPAGTVDTRLLRCPHRHQQGREADLAVCRQHAKHGRVWLLASASSGRAADGAGCETAADAVLAGRAFTTAVASAAASTTAADIGGSRMSSNSRFLADRAAAAAAAARVTVICGLSGLHICYSLRHVFC